LPTSLYKDPETILTELITNVQQLGAPITDFNVNSVARTLCESFAIVVSGQGLLADQLRLDSYLATATGDALDAKVADYLVTRKAAAAATGTIRVTRATSGSTLFIPAGWAQLSTKPVPGQSAVAIVTTSDASMASADLTVDIPVVAVVGGVAGNLSAGTVVVPQTALTGVDSNSGIVVQIAMTGGVNAETDDALRARVQIEVAGRVNGTSAALEAAALSITGVESANVLKAGDARGDASIVPGGSVEVYYEGASSLQPSVFSACFARSTLNQNLSVFTSTGERMVVACTVTAKTGVDTVALGINVKAAIEGVVNAVGVGGKLYYADTIKAIHDTQDVLAVNVPLADHRKFSQSGGTAADVQMTADRFASLADVDVSVAITLV
jgi:uncharacterized phage protein gp47/JayE